MTSESVIPVGSGTKVLHRLGLISAKDLQNPKMIVLKLNLTSLAVFPFSTASKLIEAGHVEVVESLFEFIILIIISPTIS